MPLAEDRFETAERRIKAARRDQATKLDLSDLGLSSVPESLGQLTQLRNLNLMNNQLTSVPECIGRFAQLETLYLCGNLLASVPESIGRLTELRILELSHNRLVALPDSVGQLSQLEELYVYDNQLKSLPGGLRQLRELKNLYLHGNPQLGLPPEVLGPPWDEVRNRLTQAQPASPKAILAYYFESRQRDGGAMNAAKLLLVGQGCVGKTSLVRYLVNGQRQGGRTMNR